MANILTRAARLLRLRHGRPHLNSANLHRDRAEWIEAVVGYRRALEWLPWRDDIHIQIGNCLKEYGDYRASVSAYNLVTSGAHRPEALKQIADTNRRAGFVTLPYAFAEDPAQLGGGRGDESGGIVPRARDLPNRAHVETLKPRRWLGSLAQEGGGPVRVRRSSERPAIIVDRVGSLSLSHNGATEPLLAGVVAIRARITARARIEQVELWLGEGQAARCIATETVAALDRDAGGLRLHVANVWLDSARLPAGRRWLAIRAGKHAPATGLFVHVADPDAPPLDLPGSDAYVPSPAAGVGDLASAVVAAPAQVRPAARSLFDRPIRSILAMRVDQLGDVSASLPAMARLRALFPEARLTALVQPGVQAVVEASGIADEVLTLTLPYNTATERRSLPPAEEERIRAACAERRFDLAIDLSPGDEVRPVLLLTGATYLVGFNADRFTFLDFGIGFRSRDKVNQLDIASHAATVMALVEALAVVVAPARPIVRRVAPVAALLGAHGLGPGGHIVLHTGARHAINRWPVGRFLDLAEALLAETTDAIVIFLDDPAECDRSGLRDSDRVRILSAVDGDTFDAVVSTARLMVGNDSGPKHLAATRGVPTVSVHVGRLNWNEWGQDGQGTIVSKRVPCSGCGLNDVRLCGRDAVCVRSITVEEVRAAALALL